jgi:hypothetical protein
MSESVSPLPHCIGGRERGPQLNLRAYPAAGAGSQFTSTLHLVMTHEAWQEAGRGTKSPKTNLAESKSACYAAVRYPHRGRARTWTVGRAKAARRAVQVHHGLV